MFTGHKHGVEFSKLRDHGVAAAAEITELEWKKRKNGGSEKEHVAHIQFTMENGQQVRDTVSIPESLARQLRAREIPWSIDIRYLPESPSTLVKAGDNDTSDGEKGFARILLLAGIAVLVLRHFFAK
ncbi:hypothetical protein ASD07_28090 [Duganella sp. Root336D2]|nr:MULTISPECIES: hypothetical protein [unclassified Duganella]KQV55404.1 hypothetical protein ASD07_28090 [Duganella sp. Root336D2]